jgi:hypothetical protein
MSSDIIPARWLAVRVVSLLKAWQILHGKEKVCGSGSSPSPDRTCGVERSGAGVQQRSTATAPGRGALRRTLTDPKLKAEIETR